MSTFRDWKVVNKLSDRGQTNSEVHLLQKKDSDEFIVRKVIHGIDHPLYQAIFTREMRALYKLNKSENIVSIVGDDYLKETKTGEKVGVIYLEYINGVELGKVQIENLSSKEKFSIVRQLLDAIEISHSNGIIHRDINPNNIMVTEDKVVKVIDFGICKINDMINSATVFTLGTNAYSAPEVHQHSENATEKSDLYSIGAVIYYLFTGKQPPLAVQFQKTMDSVRGMDIELKPIVKKLVAENPDDRYENIFELRKDISRLFMRFLDTEKTVVFTMAYERFKELKNFKLLPQSVTVKEAAEGNLPENFLEMYAFCKEEDDEKVFIFLGYNYLMECIYEEELNVFDVLKFRKVVPIDRDRLRKRYAQVVGKVRFVDKKFAHTFINMRINQLREEGAKEEIDLVPALKDYYTRHMADGTFVSWLALDGKNIIGTSGMSFVEKPPYFGCPNGKIGLLSSMFTEPQYRRKGIAKELLSRVVNEAREYGCGVIQITASDMGVKLYTDFGFVHNGNFMQYEFS